MLKNILNLNGVQLLNKQQQVLLKGGNPNPDPDPFGNNGYKKCKLCGGNSDCPGSTCASGIPYCSDSSKRCL